MSDGCVSDDVARAMIRAAVLADVRHAFFTRQGGVSQGVYTSLNGGVGSQDDAAAVAENRARMAGVFEVSPKNLLVPYQIHSADALAVLAPWAEGARPRCDELVTATPGLALGVTGADCGMLLFADRQAGVIGAAHAGWKGALTGMVEALVAAMELLGANRANIRAALGPTIGPHSYEVGPEFYELFRATDPSFARFFAPSAQAGRFMFDLPGFIEMRVERTKIGAFENLALDTYGDETRFFSYRRTTHRKEADYGRLVAAIALSGFAMIESLRIFQTTPQLTAFIPLRIPREDIRKVMGPGLAELRAVVAAQNITVTGPWFTHHVINPGENFDFEICLPVAAPVAPTGRVQPGEWPAMTIAQTVYHGGYEGLGSAWGEFIAAIKAEGREIAEGLWECYVIGPETSADPAAWRTVLSKPLVET